MKNRLPRKVILTCWIPDTYITEIIEQDLGEIKETLLEMGYESVNVQIEE